MKRTLKRLLLGAVLLISLVVLVFAGLVVYFFNQRSIDDSFVRVMTILPPRQLVTMEQMNGFNFPIQVFVGRQKQIAAMARYWGLNQEILVPNAKIEFHVRQSRGGQVIRFDPATATIEALHLGDALIELRYHGASVTQCIQVRETEGFDRSACEELAATDNGQPATPPGADAPAANWDSRLPYTAEDNRQGRFEANERAEIVPPGHPFWVGEENPLQIKIHSGTVVRVDCEVPEQPCLPRNNYQDPVPGFTFTRQPDGDLAIEVFPYLLEKETFDISIYFSDGGVAHKWFSTDVQLGSKLPRGINMPCGNDSYGDPNLPVRISLSLQGAGIAPGSGEWINACYDGIPSFVALPPQVLSYRVWSDEAEPAIAVNTKTGHVTGVHAGQALLERRFRGLKSETCFVVQLSDGHEDKLPNCENLRARAAARTGPAGTEKQH